MKSREAGSKILAYFIKTFNGMALGLFASLIIGVILEQAGNLTNFAPLQELGIILKGFLGVAIGIGIAWSLGLTNLGLIAGALTGGIAAKLYNDPMVIYITTVTSIEIYRLILRRKTPLDILLIPLLTSALAFGIAKLIGNPVSIAMSKIGEFIDMATHYQPFLMGIVIAVIMGMALTAPISSAAIAISINLSGLAAGASVVGCSVQMLGFAVMSRKDNSIGEIISIGIGTSMLQFKNILRKPIIWLPTIIVSAILGPISTLLFKTKTTAYGAGMGTSGLVGQIGTLDAMGYSFNTYMNILVLQIILPIVLVYITDVIFRKMGWIKEGDLSLKN